MALDANQVELAMSSRPENVGLARVVVAALAAQAEFSIAEIEEIKVAVSEAVTNAVVHGYRSAPDATVWLEARLRGGDLEVAVVDHGCGIADIELARRPAFSSDPERMGMGFMFMENFMDSLDIASTPGHGTRVVMHKRPTVLPPAAGERV